jgi:hypothetical protein
MPRFFFNFSEGDEFVADFVGEDHSTPARAIRAALDMFSDLINGSPTLSRTLRATVVDAAHTRVAELSLDPETMQPVVETVEAPSPAA